MRTLLVTLEYPPFNGGVAEYYFNLYKHWPDNNFFVLAGSTKVEREDESRVVRKKLIIPIFSWLISFFHVFQTIRKNKIEHVVIGQVLPIGTVVFFLSYLMGFEYSIVMHGMDYEFAKRKKRKRILAYNIIKKAKHIFLGNSYLQALLIADLPSQSDKILVVNPGVSTDIEQINDAIDKEKGHDDFKLFFIGRLVKRKGVDKVIEALGLIDQKKFPDLKYQIAGTGPDEEYFKSLTNDSRIEFLGRISDNEKWKYMKEADVFITCSRNIDGDFEGFGIVYIEANLAGTPVIATNSGGVSDAVENNLSGLLLENDKPFEIKEAIMKLYNNRGLAKDLGEKGKKRVYEKFLWNEQVKKIFNRINQ
ncbi:hypothetical protein C0584_00355 [Candidatus Parcubacteria bacterium]|nr:MAG: hypothetical protein C0584_00355 [Candidatus Parcubacteria bacterium]